MSSLEIILDWSAWQRGTGLADRTVRERQYTLSHFFSLTNSEPLTFTDRDVIRYLGREGVAPSSKASYHSILRSFAAWLIKTGQRVDDPLRTIPAVKRPRSLPRPVTDADLRSTIEHASRWHTRTKIMLAALQGLRVHEIAKIAGEDFDLDAKTLRVTGKGSKTAVLPIHADLVEVALAYPRQGFWYPSDQTGSGHVTGQSVSTAIRRAMDRAGVSATPHQLRHWYGTSLLHESGDVRIVQELMRHENIQSTQIYTKVDPERQRDTLNNISLPAAA
ncbi:tyrosine-type recombinase/integrase [Glutamicibacter sp. NPDC087673]|uniref:tyrosine-type recombinase/integrase n=1 Tax=Glutamicibacter sp. NPDC087673 TaxID=3363997 RepID=UPI0037F11E9A